MYFRDLKQTISETIHSSKDLQQTHPAPIRMLEDAPETNSQFAKPHTQFTTPPSGDTNVAVNNGHLLRLMDTLSKISEIQSYIAANIPKTVPFYQTEDLYGPYLYSSSSNLVEPFLHKTHRSKSPLHSHLSEPFTTTSSTPDYIPTSTRQYRGASDQDHVAKINCRECRETIDPEVRRISEEVSVSCNTSLNNNFLFRF